MNSSLGESIARLARAITTHEAEDKEVAKNPPESIDAEVTKATGEATEKPPESIDAEVTKATGVDAMAHKLPANKEDPTETEAEKE